MIGNKCTNEVSPKSLNKFCYLNSRTIGKLKNFKKPFIKKLTLPFNMQANES